MPLIPQLRSRLHFQSPCRRQEISAVELIDSIRDLIAAFKLPRRVIFVDEIVRAPSGKADYRWAKSRALEASDADA